jgi:hypothetical protein
VQAGGVRNDRLGVRGYRDDLPDYTRTTTRTRTSARVQVLDGEAAAGDAVDEIDLGAVGTRALMGSMNSFRRSFDRLVPGPAHPRS